MNQEKDILLFDGVCNLCNGFIRFLHHRDSKDQFRYVSLQSEKAKQLLSEFEYSDDELKTFVFIQNGRLFTKSTAALNVLKKIGLPYSIASVFKIVPKFIRNSVYDFIAKNRYKWFGKQDEVCEFDPNFNAKKI